MILNMLLWMLWVRKSINAQPDEVLNFSLRQDNLCLSDDCKTCSDS